MKRKILVFLIFTAFSISSMGEDIIHATSEDIGEFDQLLENQPMAKEGQPKKKQKLRPRDGFMKGKGRSGNGPQGRRPKGPPRDDRERGRRKPPPHKGGPGGPGGGNPPPPPPN